MCENCGCETVHSHDGVEHTHKHEHSHDHKHEHVGQDGRKYTHTHSHEDEHSHEEGNVRKINVEKKILSKNDDQAELNKKFLKSKGVLAINMISSPGTGKTMLLEKTLDMLRGKLKCAVITGDQQTDNDAKRLQGKGAEVRQIETVSSCHLNAEQISLVLPEVVDGNTDILFIENVGNLVCPAAFELGEDFKMALLSCTEGEDKALKYPVIFSNAQLAVITKTDLVEHLDWDMAECRKNIRKVHPGIFIFELSAKSGSGMEEWIDYLVKLVR